MTMTAEKRLALVGAVATLAALPVAAWIEAHALHLAWHGILRHSVPALPTLGLWEAWALSVALKLFTAPSQFTVKKDDRETVDYLWAQVLVHAAATYGVVWLLVRYVIGGAA